MSGFSPDWLALREPFDLAARNAYVRGETLRHIASRTSLVLTDLGSGTGSTIGALSRDLPARQYWHLHDHDTALLAIAKTRAPDRDITIETHHLDLARYLEAAFTSPSDLVTMSALLDLVSMPWLTRLVDAIAIQRLPVYAALTYNGEIAFGHLHPIDHAIVAAVNAHQLTDKGFGPALGPGAAEAAIALWQSRGYSVVQGTSDWTMSPPDQAIQLELLAGWATAALDMQELPAADIRTWLADRSAEVQNGTSTMRVGHTDFLAIPSTQR